MKNNLSNIRSEIFPLIIIAATIILSIWWYPQLPERVASHWNFQGQVDGHSSKLFMSWFIPSLLTGMYILFLFLPHLDPKKNRYQEFASSYHLIKNALITVLFIIFVTTNLYNLKYAINIPQIVSLTIGLLMIIIGSTLRHIKPNWFMGIRTPWTLSSETVWNKTHQLGGWCFMLWGLSLIIAPYLPTLWAALILFGGIVAVVLVTFVYSYVLYRQEQKNHS